MMRPIKTKTPQGGQAEGAFNTTNSKGIFTYLREAIKRRIWLIGYDLEETRQTHAASGHFWKEAVVCIALALLRFGRLV